MRERREDWAKAEPLYELLVRKTEDGPVRASLYQRQARCARQLGKLDQAATALAAAAALDRPSLPLARELADLQVEREAWAEARTEYERAKSLIERGHAGRDPRFAVRAARALRAQDAGRRRRGSLLRGGARARAGKAGDARGLGRAAHRARGVAGGGRAQAQAARAGQRRRGARAPARGHRRSAAGEAERLDGRDRGVPGGSGARAGPEAGPVQDARLPHAARNSGPRPSRPCRDWRSSPTSPPSGPSSTTRWPPSTATSSRTRARRSSNSARCSTTSRCTPRPSTPSRSCSAEAKEWKDLERAYRKQIKRLPHDAPGEVKLRLWDGLADVALKQHDKESAMLTMEVAVKFDRDNLARQERLARMYFDMGPAQGRQGHRAAPVPASAQARPSGFVQGAGRAVLPGRRPRQDVVRGGRHDLPRQGRPAAARALRELPADPDPGRARQADRRAVAQGGSPRRESLPRCAVRPAFARARHDHGAAAGRRWASTGTRGSTSAPTPGPTPRPCATWPTPSSRRCPRCSSRRTRRERSTW